MKQCGLDLCKFVAFGSDGTSTMVGSKNGVATQIRNEVNSFILSRHYVAHRTNLAVLDVAKTSAYKTIFNEVESLLILVASFFKKSSKRKYALATL